MFTSTLRRSLAMRPATRAGRRVLTPRPFHILPRQLARKDTQDKDSLKPEPSEYSKSGSDDAAAAVDDAAFNPDITSPEQEQASAKEQSGSDAENPLEVSPANQEVSKPKEQLQGQTEGSSAESGGSGSSGRQRTSGGSSPPKSGGGKHGGGSQGV
ncbi:hypothetical protein LTR35_007662 [Friedmanniomyces endolithicus]|nr:hypothetical protein LTR35_007662 [Friedmanniomyces endolithicus]KAK0295247.1 hypothetical protein LTS00_006305 [Friedmanniomyces endolithicus]